MVAARERVHGAGAFDPVAAAVAEIVSAVIAETVGPAGPVHPYGPVVADIGCGTGHYLAAVLDARPDARGIGIDLSKSCARATVRSHIRSAAVVADAWSGLPIRSSSVAAVLSVFSPRNVADFARILRPGGVVVTVTPEPGHLAELAGPAAAAARERRDRAAPPTVGARPPVLPLRRSKRGKPAHPAWHRQRYSR